MKNFLLFSLLVLSACAHSPEDLKTDLDAVGKECVSQKLNTAVENINCIISEAKPVIEKDAPVAMLAAEKFTSKSRALAQNFDEKVAIVKMAMNRFLQGDKEAAAILAAHESQWHIMDKEIMGKNAPPLDEDTLLDKDILLMQLGDAHKCTSQSFLDRTKCLDSFTRPIWEKDAPDTMEYYNEFQENRFKLAKEFDDTGSIKLMATEKANLQKGLKEAVNEFWADARQAIQEQEQQQQAADAQSSAENAAAAAQGLKFIGELAVAFLQGMAAASPVPPTPAPTVQAVQVQQQPTITHTNCQYNTVFHQTQCTTTPY